MSKRRNKMHRRRERQAKGRTRVVPVGIRPADIRAMVDLEAFGEESLAFDDWLVEDVESWLEELPRLVRALRQRVETNNKLVAEIRRLKAMLPGNSTNAGGVDSRNGQRARTRDDRRAPVDACAGVACADDPDA